MRQLKNFMKAKKPMWNCGECKCITLQCWRENDEFCNCGENVTPPTPPTPTTHTITFTANPIEWWSVSVQTLVVEHGAAIHDQNPLIIGENFIDATPNDGYIFDHWETWDGTALPETVTDDMTIEVIFDEYIPVETISAPSVNSVQVTEWDVNIDVTFDYTPADATQVDDDITFASSDENIAFADFEGWESWTATIQIHWVSEWTCTVNYSLGWTSYSIDVEVIPGL